MGILNVGTQALQANLIALQTAGNNIANANVEGYSRQRAVMETVAGQYTGSGYIGKGVTVQTVQRAYDSYLSRQSNVATTTQASDVLRADYLGQLSNIFQGGADGLGAAINEMLNAFSDVASAPTDLTARTVVLTRVDETARRLRAASQSLDDLQIGISQALREKVDSVNTIAQGIADLNEQIARAQGGGQPPNDLLDRRDQLIRDMNKYVQTTSIRADDGSIGIFLAGSQPLVLGTTVAEMTIVTDDYGDPLKNKVAISRNGIDTVLDENLLGGGEISGLLKFQNTDLVEGRNLLGRLTLAVTTSMNNQHKLGLDLDGQVGGDIFTPVTFGADNVLVPTPPATINGGGTSVTLSIADATKFSASDYEITFDSANGGNIVRRSDGVATAFSLTPPNDAVTLDGITISFSGVGTAVPGDRFLIKPFSTSANNIAREFATPRSLAVASPVAASITPTNKGSIAVAALSAKDVAGIGASAIHTYQINFTGGSSYDIVDTTTSTTVVSGATYISGQSIDYPTPTPPSPGPGFSITLTGTPVAGDSITILDNPHWELSGGNATEMMNLRDVATFDGAAMTDGYAGLIAQIGIRTQSANYSAEVSTNIAVNAEKERAGVSGVNLDEEAAKLLQYQQAYQASAKMIQIAQSIFDTLIQGLGR